MIPKQSLVKIHDWLWEIPKSYRHDMRVPARVWTSEKMLEDILGDRSLEQAVNVTTLPGIAKAALVMPDVHEGYGFPIGGVAAMRWPDGVISPGGIGYDINCGVRLLKSELSFNDVAAHLSSLARELYHEVPSGVGRGGTIRLNIIELDRVLKDGVGWAIKHGYGEDQDARYLESSGALADADPSAVSEHAKNRGRDQLGTMGAGNHFVEVDKVTQIFDSSTAKTFGLWQNQIVILIHCGSRGLGHQVATDYIRLMQKIMPRYHISLPDRELACTPLSSLEGKNYFNAMAAAANFAWANRQLITHEIRNSWRKEFGASASQLSILYDVAHNIAKIEEHIIDDKPQKLIMHRKGATRAFGPGHPEVIEEYRAVGQPVIIPGSMGTASYVLAGTKQAMKESFGSSCHGAGRRMSRHAAKRAVQGGALRDQLAKQGIHIQTGSLSGLAEEAPLAYKNIDDVVDVVSKAGLAKKVARLEPLVVVKG
ncbi:RNA-splicing ligase RtcB [Candidatus Uhrbacteria bacterium RIFCSPLOWO2_12_FULL_46_10]|uniref:tRNA-splicing ligase RtcB n=1 Tax=Candidatus Uhrbacteria bacterium RIFCSPLOWO2_01_FULL_47_25 TaxID=1802402 RepID=A0A1F7UV35_9BACT|nr:MAG: RNA-splicing ligase RtcB [Parcubacteria group bacterium GW2011_GWA2_46_9]OGL59049.1 MAG: RNA-splicing ligase RtcB [Candidatus Uhrbacteria bacterium RIFCSPHIGHO2_01_FULL_46_23]OGL68716.1 MAG: RNA-splicing ligase RtcB [Candidatus Uhrbacteria bacterium RIFCSPHIGHO2_02_FULL_47_29]OGL74742.1 MAG: RNA-splicing ligase RtcB [Candidatus Uhrbacteria bacterium RIFCSPHIGHO2_12_FULL_46_13]OGL82153.1 MAG: RNA-splicing ligase RtcB [Candidatus Uhrbacteria bacterium RIFCSPLOWO2_01_FULL_47_25]OGL85662.1